MANSQGFTLPFTGRLGKLTTGYRAGRYITRVIPDVKPTGVPTDEQVMQRDLFGKVSAFYSSLKSVVDLGFASKRGDAMNYAIKKNWSQFYLGSDFELGYNFPELSFSDGKLAPVSITRIYVSSRVIRVSFVDDYAGPQYPNDRFCIIWHFVESDKVEFDFRSRRITHFFTCANSPQHKGENVEVSAFLFSESGEVSPTQFCGTILYDW